MTTNEVPVLEVRLSGDMYYDYWVVVEKNGELFAALCDARDLPAARSEAARDVKAPYTLRALAHVGHTAYNMVGPGFRNQVAGRVLEVASAALGVPYAEAPPDAPQIPERWVGEEIETDTEGDIARQEAALEWACEQGQIPGAMPADI